MKNLCKILIIIILSCSLLSCKDKESKMDENYDSKIKEELMMQELKEKVVENYEIYRDLPSEERMEKLNIDIEVLDKVDTEGLIDLCFENGFYGIPMAYNDPISGLDYFGEHFNPVKVLLTRDDAENCVNVRLEENEGTEDFYVKRIFLETVLKKLSLNNE